MAQLRSRKGYLRSFPPKEAKNSTFLLSCSCLFLPFGRSSQAETEVGLYQKRTRFLVCISCFSLYLSEPDQATGQKHKSFRLVAQLECASGALIVVRAGFGRARQEFKIIGPRIRQFRWASSLLGCVESLLRPERATDALWTGPTDLRPAGSSEPFARNSAAANQVKGRQIALICIRIVVSPSNRRQLTE